MRLSQLRRSVRAKVRSAVIDALESRLLFAGETVKTPFTPVLANTTPNAITLNQHFNDDNIPGTLATFVTSYGTIEVALTDAATPLTVANFLHYLNSGAYTDTIFHRSAILNGSGGTVSAKTPADIIQGGGYVPSGTTFTHIATTTPVKDEYTSRLYGNIAGTLAMAKTANANSATSEWYFNRNDNTTALDTPTTDSNGVTTSYTVFGKVYKGLVVVNEIAALPTTNADFGRSTNSSTGLTTLPVTGLTAGQTAKHFPVTANNLIYTDRITTTPGTAYTATSSDSSLVTATITDGVLSFKYATGKSGTANITINAKNLDGTSTTGTVSVTVPNSATPTAGPTAGAITAPDITTGKTGSFSVLGTATDSAAALNPSSVTIVIQPAHGTATVDTTTGLISYTSTAGYTGTDTLSYTVADTAGTVSAAATVNLNVVAAPVTLTIGNATARSLAYTQPNGSVGHLFIGSGAAVVTFASSNVTVTTANGVATAVGSGATIASIVITNRGSAATLSLTSSGPVSLGSVSDAGRLAFINAPLATLTGIFNLGSTSRVTAAAATNATLSLGSGNSVVLAIPSVTNTNLSDTGSIARITSKQWLSTDGGFYGILASKIGQLKVSGAFADSLSLSSAGTSLQSVTVGQASGAWVAGGSITTATVSSPLPTWSVAANGNIGKLAIVGNLGASNISAGSIGTLSVTGATAGATVNTTDAFSTKHRQISALKFTGALTHSTITALGSIGTLTAPSMDTNTIGAGTFGSISVKGIANAVTISTSATSVLNRPTIATLKIGQALTNSAVTTSGNVGAITSASMATNTLTALSISSLIVSGATSAATINTNSSATADGRFRFGGALTGSTITAAASIGNLTAASLDTTNLTASSIASLTVAGATSAAKITTTATAVKDGTLRFGGAVSGSTIAASGDVGSITAASLTTNTFTVAAIHALNVTGTTTATTISSTSSTSSVDRVHFGGAVIGTKIAAAGSIGSIAAVSLSGSQIYAGVTAAVTAVPTLAASAGDLSANVRIGSVTLGRGAAAFSNSLISADLIGSLRLGNITSANAGTTFGISAHLISAITGKLVPGGPINAGPRQLKTAATLSAYETAQKLALGDFAIKLF